MCKTYENYEPSLSDKNSCVKRQFDGNVSDNFFRAYKKEHYSSVSLLRASIV